MTTREFLTPLTIALALVLLLATIAGFVLIPADTILPVHWGPTGQADRFMPRDGALVMLPGIAALVVGLIVVAAKKSPSDRVAGARSGLRVVVPVILGLASVIQVGTVLIGLGHQVDMVRMIVLGVGVMFVVLGNVLPKSQPNMLSGVRLPWTLKSAANWQATNRLVGMLMLLGGLLMVLAALLTGHPLVLLATVLAGAIVPTLVGAIYSYRLSRGEGA